MLDYSSRPVKDQQSRLVTLGQGALRDQFRRQCIVEIRGPHRIVA